MHLVLCLIVATMLCLSACSIESGNDVKNGRSGHSTPESVEKKLVEVLKGKKLDGYETQTIGKAFDGYQYFSSTEWKEVFGDNGKIYIDLIGWFDQKKVKMTTDTNGVTLKGLNVKFVIYGNGSYAVVMIAKLGTTADGSLGVYPQQNTADILGAIYGNKRLNL